MPRAANRSRAAAASAPWWSATTNGDGVAARAGCVSAKGVRSARRRTSVRFFMLDVDGSALPPASSARGDASVDGEDGSGDVGGLVGGEEEHGARDLLRRGEAAQKRL